MSGPSNAVTNDEGLRFYVFGEGTEQEERFISVTSVLKSANKEGLVCWSAGLAADAALDNVGKLITATRTKDCGNTHKRCQHDFRVRCVTCPCGVCGPCVRKWIANRHYAEKGRRAGEGTRVHDVIEWWVLHDGEIPTHDEDIAPYVAQFLAWVEAYGLTPDSWEMTEGTVVNRAEQYAGTLDGIVRIDGGLSSDGAELVARVLQVPLSVAVTRSATVMLDFKTRENEDGKLFAEVALQLSPYRWAPVVRIKGSDEELPLPDVDGAVVVQLRPEGYLCQPVVTDELTYTAFLALAAFARWEHEYATAAVSSRSFPVPKEPLKLVKPPAAPRARKTTAAAASTKPPVAKRLPPAAHASASVVDVPLPLGPVTPRARPPKSEILASAARAHTVHPDSPRGDNIPF